MSNVQGPSAFPTATVSIVNPLETASERVLVAPPGVPVDGIYTEVNPVVTPGPTACDPARIGALDNRPYMWPCKEQPVQTVEWDAHHRPRWDQQQDRLADYYYGQPAFNGRSSRGR